MCIIRYQIQLNYRRYMNGNATIKVLLIFGHSYWFYCPNTFCNNLTYCIGNLI